MAPGGASDALRMSTDPPEWRGRTWPAPCPRCAHWRGGCQHPRKLERLNGGVPGDEATVSAWISLADLIGRRGLAPSRVKTPARCPGQSGC